MPEPPACARREQRCVRPHGGPGHRDPELPTIYNALLEFLGKSTLSAEERDDLWGCSGADEQTVLADDADDADDGERTVVIGFETPWSTPDAGITTLARAHPRLHIRLYGIEPGENHEFLTVIHHGELLHDDAREAWAF